MIRTPAFALRYDPTAIHQRKDGASPPQMVKTVAEQRGWQHSDHTQLFDAVATIAAETGDEDIDRLFEVASILHTNFCEGWYGAGRVERGLRDIEIFIDKLQPSVNE